MTDINSILGLENIKPEDIAKMKLQLQEINDSIRGGLRSANLKEYRNTYVINAQDSLDASFPMYVHFNIIPEMVKIVSINVAFWFQNFRAYATAASSGGAVSSASGGGATPTSSSGGGQTSSSVSTPSGGGATSGSTGSASGGGSTSGSGGGQTSSSGGAQTPTSSSGGGQTSSTTGGSILTGVNGTPSVSGIVAEDVTCYGIFIQSDGLLLTDKTSLGLKDVYPVYHKHYMGNHTHTVATHTHTVAVADHTHTVADHTHTTPNHTHPTHTHTTPDHTHPAHTHTVADHTHTVTITAHTHTGGAHTHDLTFGIFEDSTSPTVMFYVSKDNGLSYSLPVGSYSANQENLDITSMINTAGSKLIKFTSNARTRLSVQITIKLDISVI